MWYSPVVTSAAAGEPVSLDEIKLHLRVDHDDEDALIDDIIAAARAYIEDMTGLRLSEQSVKVACDCWSDLARLSIAPVRGVTEISIIDPDGSARVIPPTMYELRPDGLAPSIALLQSPPTRRPGSRISVTLDVGYSRNALPPAIKAALKMIAGDLYAYREGGQVGSVSSRIATSAPVEALLANHRIHLI